MPSQDLIYSVMARPLGNQVSPVKSHVKEVSDITPLKTIAEDEQSVEEYRGNERSRRERRKESKRRGSAQAQSEDGADNESPNEGGLDLYV